MNTGSCRPECTSFYSSKAIHPIYYYSAYEPGRSSEITRYFASGCKRCTLRGNRCNYFRFPLRTLMHLELWEDFKSFQTSPVQFKVDCMQPWLYKKNPSPFKPGAFPSLFLITIIIIVSLCFNYPFVLTRLIPWPYLLQHIHCIPAALHSGGEAGCCRRIVILCCLREKLGHRYLIRHPLKLEGVNAHRRVGDECSERQNHVRFKNG